MAGPAVSLTPLAPHDAIAYFRQKGLSPSFAWQDVWQQEHAKAFTVAKAMSRDVLQDIRGALDKALAEGKTFEQFKAELTPILQAKGWWGRKKLTDPLTGKEVMAQLGSDRRLRTIFQTNMRVSYAVGNWQRAWATRATFPYMQYQHNPDRYPRPQHVAWSGICLPIDDPWWETHYPPCAWGCNCSVNSLSKRMADQRGVSVTDRPAKFPPKTYVNPRTGEVTQIEEGIDPGWNYNVGKAPLNGQMPHPVSAPVSAEPPIGAPKTPSTARKPESGVDVPAQDQEVADPGTRPSRPSAADRAELKAAKDAFLAEFDIPADDLAGKVIKDRQNWPLAIGDGLFRDATGELALPRPDLVKWMRQVAKALKTYDSVSMRWGFDLAGNAVMVRQYVKRVTEPTLADIVIEFTGASWTFDVRPVPAP